MNPTANKNLLGGYPAASSDPLIPISRKLKFSLELFDVRRKLSALNDSRAKNVVKRDSGLSAQVQ
jgi:hypothetical protein